MRAFILCIVLMGFSGLYAYGDDHSIAKQHLKAGEYGMGLDSIAGRTDFDALLLRSQILNSQLMLGLADDDKASAKAAMAAGQAALTLEPTSKTARFLYASSYALFGRTVSKFTAWRKKIPTKIHVEIETALRMDPNRPQLQALLGAWHLSVVHKAGVKTAKDHFGAQEDIGIAYFDQALLAMPDDILINTNGGMMLLARNPDVYGRKAKALLETAKAGQPKDFLDAEVQKKAVGILEHWEDLDMACDLAKDFLGW